MNEAIQSIMSTNLITVSPDETIDKVRNQFILYGIHHIPVVEGKLLIGILTTYDLWKHEIAPSDYPTVCVRDVMTKKVAKISPNDKIGTAAEIFLDNRFHALPVVDNNNQLLGIVTSFDVLLYEFKKEYPKAILFKHLFDQPKKGTAHVSA